MSKKESILDSILSKDVSKVIINNSDFPSLIEDFPNKELITDLNELRLLQIILARKAIIELSGYVGEQINEGEYLNAERSDSNWQIYKLNDSTDRIAVLWSHFDDDSWSVFFKADNLELESLYYEN